jgi:3'-5' exoribonuclease
MTLPRATLTPGATRRFDFADGVSMTGAVVAGAAVVLDRADKLTKDNRPFVVLTVGNASGRSGLSVWQENLPQIDGIVTGTPVVLECRRTLGRNGVAEWTFMSVTPLPADHPVALESQPACPVSLERLVIRMNKLAGALSPEAHDILRRVMRTEIAWGDGKHESIGARFKVAPAAVGHHHAVHRGLWWHTMQVAEGAVALAEAYRSEDAPTLDIDAIRLGALLHDIGKLDELDWSGSYAVAAHGAVMTHMGWGIARLVEAVARAEHGGTPDERWTPTARQRELVQHTIHIIASHHGNTEWGALVLPASREAWCVHAADQTSSKLQPITSAQPTSPATTGWFRGAVTSWKKEWMFVSQADMGTTSSGPAPVPSPDSSDGGVAETIPVLRLHLPRIRSE